MAKQASRERMLDVHMRDLAGTLEHAERSARVLRRTIALVPSQLGRRSQGKSPGIDRLKLVTSVLAQEAQRLVQNASDCQSSMRKLQRELKRLRLG